jgi:hypothetical protein
MPKNTTANGELVIAGCASAFYVSILCTEFSSARV